MAFERRAAIAAGRPTGRGSSQVVHAAFAHRRKRLGNSLELAGLRRPAGALAGLRAEQLAPEQFLELL